MYDFFIVCPLNLEKEVLKELLSKWHKYNNIPLENYSLVLGGIELKCTLKQGLSLNYYLRSPNRILLRIKEQKCRDLPKLFKIISKLEWKKYLNKEEADFQISTKKSRLINTKKIENTAIDALKKYFNANKIKQSKLNQFKASKRAKVFIRIENDNFIISLDTTGELLYKRDDIKFKGAAPLRNNLAFIMLQYLIDETKINPKDYTLIDPMCGSGTFIHEAQKFNHTGQRSFYFEDIFQIESPHKQNELMFKDYLAFDINDDIIKKSNISIIKEDLFLGEKKPTKSITIINPPYGKKIKINEDRDIFFDKIISRVFQKFDSDYLGIIVPEKVEINVKYLKKLKVFNNGIWVNFLILKQK